MSIKHCDGSCEGHSGEVRPVTVYGGSIPESGWNFNYCDEAVAEDGRRGFRVVPAHPGEGGL